MAQRAGFGVEFEVDGLALVMSRLREFDREAYDGMIAEINDATDKIAKTAANDVPDGNALSNWGGWGSNNAARQSRGGVWTLTSRKSTRDLGFDGAKARNKIEPRVGRKFRRGKMLGATALVSQRDAAGAIWALAGSKNTGGNPYAIGGAATFVDNVVGKYPGSQWPRALGPAWNEHIDEVRAQVQDIVNRAARKASGD